MDCSSIRGMETVVATVTGYRGTERVNLIKLISHSGANYVGGMSRSITHLVCWEFEGKKYELAKKFSKTIIVNHRWIEDCIKQRKRVPEAPYVLQSGREVGPLLLEVPIIDEVRCLNMKRAALVEKSNILEEFDRLIKGKDCGDSGVAAWTVSSLLDDNLFPEIRKNNSSEYKSKPKLATKSLKQEQKSSGRYCFQDPPLSGLVSSERGQISGSEGPITRSKKRLVRGKRKVSDDIGNTSLAEPSRDGCRLVKKNFSRENLEIEILDSAQECNPIRLHEKSNNAVALSEFEDSQRIVKTFEIGTTSNATLNNNAASMYEVFDNIEESSRNHQLVSKVLNLCPEKALTALERPDNCPAIQNLDDKSNDASQSESVTQLPTSLELSCVICWTEFSSTRGVLPCGHRFCYSCIQNWADHMISSGKASTCPLCKTSFVSIAKVEDAATSDQKIYSQTIPCASSTTSILMLHDQERCIIGAESSSATVCGECCCREPEDLLINCDHCQIRCIHIYCLDPPLLPWTCIQCKDLQRLYYHAR